MNDLVMTTASTKIARPATAAGLLPINDAFGEPTLLPMSIDTLVNMSHGRFAVIYKAVAGEESAGSRDAKISGSRAAWVRPGSAPVDLLQCRHHVGERIRAAAAHLPFEFISTSDHFIEQDIEIWCLHFAVTGRRAEHRRKSHRVETQANEIIERGAQPEIFWGNRYARQYLHATLVCQQRPQIVYNSI